MDRTRFNVLSLSGGGYMGLYTARILAEMESMKGSTLRDSFDLIVGTSIGGILALALANRTPMSSVVRAFEAKGEKIFSARPAPLGRYQQARDLLRFMSGSKYSSANLRETIKMFAPHGQTMDKIDVRVAVCAVNLTRGIPHTFRSPYLAEHSNSSGISTVDVALAASAAPILFPVHKIGADLFSDGAAYANSPDLVGLHEAETLCGMDIDNIHLLSIGTTSADYDFGKPENLSLGAREWLEKQRMLKMIMSCQQNHVSRLVKGRLSERFTRIDEIQTSDERGLLALDVADLSARKTLAKLSQRTISRMRSDCVIQDFLNHNARPVSAWYPYNGVLPKLI